MKKIIMWSGVAMGLTWVADANAQPINFGNPSTSNHQSNRPMDKDDYAEEVEERWERLKQNFSKRQRKIDPFGSKMNPDLSEPEKKIVIKEIVQPDKPIIKAVSLQEAVNKFRPNLIAEKRQQILYGSRTLQLGDPVQIEHDGVLFNLLIVKITSNEVTFINTENQEKATYREKGFDPRKMEENDRSILQKMQQEQGPVRIN